MNKITGFILFAAAILLLQAVSYSQVKFSAGPSLGMVFATGDYGGSTIEYYRGQKYGLDAGLNVGAMFKAKFPAISLRGDLHYASMSNSGNSESGKGYIEVKQNLFTIGVGPEFSIKNVSPSVTPYFGAQLLMTFFSGETTFQGVAKVPTGTFAMSSESRAGFGFGFGAEISIAGKYAVDFGFKYNLLNVLGRSFSSGSDERLNSYLSLNDDKDPVAPSDPDKHPVSSDRSINVFRLDVAFLFGF